MTAINKRMLASVAIAAGVTAPAVGGLVVAAGNAAATPSSVVAHLADKDDSKKKDKDDSKKKDDDDSKKASVDAAQKILDKIEDAKDAKSLNKDLSKDIDGLKDNESAIPSKVKDEYKKFEKELQDAKDKKSLTGDDASDTFKKIQKDAKTLSSDLKDASSSSS